MDVKALIVNHLDRILNFWLVVDSEERIVHCCRLIYEHLGYSEADLINQPFHFLFPNDPQINDYLFQLLFESQIGTIVNQRTRIKQKNGIIIDVDLSAYQLSYENSQFILIAFENITEVVEIRKIVPRPVLLIACGKYEIHYNRRFHAAAGESCNLWEIPKARYAAGLAYEPQEYPKHVVGFFNRALHISASG